MKPKLLFRADVLFNEGIRLEKETSLSFFRRLLKTGELIFLLGFLDRRRGGE